MHVLAPNPGRISPTLATNFNRQDLDNLRFSPSFLQQRQGLAMAMERDVKCRVGAPQLATVGTMDPMPLPQPASSIA
ncbi:MAG: hypothetical protein F4226_02245 [Synechococcus sp. SB0678_bin_12]|nr:hypothetical protein [Synechococcus sp. SB0678_bin_12]